MRRHLAIRGLSDACDPAASSIRASTALDILCGDQLLLQHSEVHRFQHRKETSAQCEFRPVHDAVGPHRGNVLLPIRRGAGAERRAENAVCLSSAWGASRLLRDKWLV